MRRRRLIAAAWIAGATVPLLLATLFVAGCCVLPFHGLIHKMMPACEIAAHLMQGGHDHDDHSQPSPPAQERQEPAKQFAASLTAVTQFPHAASQELRLRIASAAAYRSFITLGALRCDQDVGVVILDRTFLI